MKRKNGFTLVELLAVIIVLGLIALIIVPKINDTIRDARINTNKVSTSSLARTAENYYLEQKTKNRSFNSCTYDFENNLNTCVGLEFTGEKPESGKLSIRQNGEVALAIKFNKKCFIKEYDTDEIETIDYNESTCGENADIFANYEIPQTVNNGTGLYESDIEPGRYIYRGENPNNYILLKEDNVDTYYRIVSFESDGTIKVIRNEKLSTEMPWDENIDDTSGPRYNENNTYCHYQDLYKGCNAWGNMNNTYYNGEKIKSEFDYKFYQDKASTTLSSNSEKKGTVTMDSSLNTYLNNTWLSATKLDKYIKEHEFNVGGVYYYNGYTGGDKGLIKEKNEESLYKWNGKIGLMNITEYVQTSTNPSCTSVWSSSYYNPSEEKPCSEENWAHKEYHQWTLTAFSYSSRAVWVASAAGSLDNSIASESLGVTPSFYLKPSVILSGTGTYSNPYTITNM